MLRDTLLPLVDIPLRFGLDPRDFTWIQWPSGAQYSEDWRANATTLTHYKSWFPRKEDTHEPLLWKDFLRKLRSSDVRRGGSDAEAAPDTVIQSVESGGDLQEAGTAQANEAGKARANEDGRDEEDPDEEEGDTKHSDDEGEGSGGAEAPEALADDAQGPMPKRYIRFPRLVAGVGATSHIAQFHQLFGQVDHHTLSAWAHMCSPWPWRSMRTIAYGNNGITHRPAFTLPPRVTIIQGSRAERRNFQGNVNALLPPLRRLFPGVQIDVVKMSELSGEWWMMDAPHRCGCTLHLCFRACAKCPALVAWMQALKRERRYNAGEEQTEILSKTTVLVTSIGSRSFRMVYLPDGAQVILVGPPEKLGRRGDEVNPAPFREVEWCWAYLGYFNMILYRCGSLCSAP
jgi:hypothetical protein